MDWFKLSSAYYRDPKVMRAGEAAEVLFVRSLAFAAEQETDGHVPSAALLLICPVKPGPRVQALLQEGLWRQEPDGWVIPGWGLWQETQEKLQARRDAGRRRSAAHRARHRDGVRNGVTHTVANASGDGPVTEAEVEREVEPAAAAAGHAAAAAAAELPAAVDILRSKLHAVTALRGLRFDRLHPDRLTEIERLVTLHGDQVLVDVAVRTCRTPPPVHVSAFIGTWAALPAPGQRLAVVKEPDCELHPAQREPASRCRYCAADRLAGDA